MSFASNKNAYGICDISGFRYRLKDMRKTWDGLLVGPDQYDPKHPQLQPRHKPADPEALRDPRPNTDFEVGQGKVVTTEDPIGAMIIGNKLTASVYQVFEFSPDSPIHNGTLCCSLIGRTQFKSSSFVEFQYL